MLDVLEKWDRNARILLNETFTEQYPAREYPDDLRQVIQGVEEAAADTAPSAREYPSLLIGRAFGHRLASLASIKSLLVLYDESSYRVSNDQQYPASSSAEPATVEVAHDVPPAAATVRPPDGPIFVVHGHARGSLLETVRVLERATGREVIILHEQANAGRTILEKFEDYANRVSFAVVLLTGDDKGGTQSGDNLKPRGRQNVIFELGFFFGKLGRMRVVVLHENNVEKPSDIDGLVYVTFDSSGAWKYDLARELEAAGIAVDRSKIR
jgi:predicted nucleotide-binding protein